VASSWKREGCLWASCTTHSSSAIESVDVAV
jgi:hypothetical protein